MIKTRDEVLAQDCWNVEALYPNLEEWQTAFYHFVKDRHQKPYWPTLASLRGTLDQGANRLKATLEELFKIDRTLTKLYTYAHLRHDENIINPTFKKTFDEIVAIAHACAQETAWIQPELISLSDELLSKYLKDPLLADYHFYLEQSVRAKKHTLSPESEMLIAQAGQALQTASKAFRALNDADFQFGTVRDSLGDHKQLTHGNYALYIRDHDRVLRKNALENYHNHYKAYENTLCELLTGQVQNHHFQSQVRHYPSCLDASLFPKNISTSVYDALIHAVNSEIGVLHRYMELRKKVLGLDELHAYDLYVPLTSSVDIKMSYDEAVEVVIESVAPLGTEYQNILHQGLKKDGWVDRYENKNKRSGAYSSGCYDSMPYVLMNYKNLLRDVFTLAHEAGHSMHSYYSNHHQPFHYSGYPIFLAEVASTFNEDLLTRLLMERCTDPQEKIFLLNQKVEDVRGTLFRQTMFAEFELLIHKLVEQGTPLTPQLLNQEYHKLNEKYFGPAVVVDACLDSEWSRIPHFYYNFYVYQYATGISAALHLAEKVCSGDAQDRQAYLNFLKAGSSKYPIDILKIAGVDMESPLPVRSAIHKMEQDITELEALLAVNNYQC